MKKLMIVLIALMVSVGVFGQASAYLTAGIVPYGAVAMYDNPDPTLLHLTGNFFTEVGVQEILWKRLILETHIRTDAAYHVGGAFFPMSGTWTVGASYLFPDDNAEVGVSYRCYHVIEPYAGILAFYGEQAVPKYEGSYAEVHITFWIGDKNSRPRGRY